MGPDSQVDQTVAGMTQFLVVEASIPGKEGGAGLSDQKSSEAIVLDAFFTDVAADQEGSHPPTAQQLPLALRDVLIKDDHGAGWVSGRVGLHDVVVDVLEERSGGQLQCLGNSLP